MLKGTELHKFVKILSLLFLLINIIHKMTDRGTRQFFVEFKAILRETFWQF